MHAIVSRPYTSISPSCCSPGSAPNSHPSHALAKNKLNHVLPVILPERAIPKRRKVMVNGGAASHIR
ncbi:hypothetical protein SAICODRAFT_133109 [Saitoella complicata NRRL Y-17804]|uniref:uncharacterized protein n=1 Tax=Saitoella complicata (strain BCRC 22490 / CBS 7301 / JCM 7358 / NBRC 10748 / NRRL Y-17804) TaxID=698492 RepID=UPI000867579F|nr:uncharacterized protein SAICODRAFT_133109 [Saitoella complicata NRRL Y-17804]ODQ52309.1 hypothetical protein SAICODRAFT_133109 [Saitoella complicata NRRL Y-17804]